MSMNFLAAKGSLKPQTDLTQLQQQMAQMFVNNQAQNEQQPDELRVVVSDLVKNNLMNPVEMPKYTTLKDVLNAQKGQGLRTFADFLDNPQTMRTIGDFMPKFGYNPQTGKLRNVMEDKSRQQEALMQAEQEKALEQQKMQNNLANAIYGDFIHQDIAEMQDARAREQMKQQAEQFEKEIAFKREENAKDRAMRMGLASLIHGGGGGGRSGGSSTGGAANIGGVDLSKVKMTAAERKALTENKTTIANIDAGLQSLEKNKDAYTFWKGIVGSDIANRIDPKGIGTRTQIDNITAVYRKWLTGAQMSDKERKAYERFLPAPTDNYNIVKAKLKGMRGAVQRSNDAILSNYGIGGSSDPLGLGL